MPNNITIQRILAIVLQRIKFIILLSLVCMLSFFLYSKFFITPMYNTSSMLYVQNYNSKSQSNQEGGKIYSSDILGSASLAEAYIVFLTNSDSITSLYNGCNVSITNSQKGKKACPNARYERSRVQKNLKRIACLSYNYRK